MRLAHLVKPLFSRTLDAVLPPRCLKCGDLIAPGGALCADCWRGLSFLGPPCCAQCGLPFDFDRGAGALCGECLARPPLFRRQRAALRYDEASRELILAFKHADRTEAAPGFARWLEQAGAESIAEADFVAPIPLHWSRLFRRRYNQAALLAGALARRGGRVFAPDLLRRIRATERQGHKSRSARWRNVAGAIAVAPAWIAAIQGRRILVVDDVVTTGATVGAATKALLAAGAAAVDILALARVVKAD